MDARRSRNGSAQRLAEFRWWGSVLLAMFALVQTARGAAGFPNAAADPTGGYSISPCVSRSCMQRSCAAARSAFVDTSAAVNNLTQCR